MKQLWAPWRMQYILGPKSEGCVLCGEPQRDEERLVLARSPHAVVMLNRFPYTNGHLLVLPVRHVGRLWQLEPEQYQDLCLVLLKTVRTVQEALQPHGMNVGMNIGEVAGAGVDDHLHVHVVPRWSGDHNYMTVLGDVRLINEHLQETFRRLKPFFDQWGK